MRLWNPLICSNRLQHFLKMKVCRIISYLVFSGLFFSCSFFLREEREVSQKMKTPTYKREYNFIDKEGQYSVYREVGRSKKKKNYVVKKRVYSRGEKKEMVEKSIAIATPGHLKGVNIVRPQIAQYTAWFDKKKYFSELKLDVESKSMILKMDSPEEQWKGKRKIPFPQGTGVYCFFSMLVECVTATGFVDKAIEKGNGSMNFHVIWDGYPYLQEQYRYLPDEVFSAAKLIFEGSNESGDKKFSLSTGGQTIFFFIEPEGFLKKMFWVSQGISMVFKKGESL